MSLFRKDELRSMIVRLAVMTRSMKRRMFLSTVGKFFRLGPDYQDRGLLIHRRRDGHFEPDKRAWNYRKPDHLAAGLATTEVIDG